MLQVTTFGFNQAESMQIKIAISLIALISYPSFANRAHELGKDGKWQEVGQLIRSGDFDVEEMDSAGRTLSDIALDRGELEQFEFHCYSYQYGPKTDIPIESPPGTLAQVQIEPPATKQTRPNKRRFKGLRYLFCL